MDLVKGVLLILFTVIALTPYRSKAVYANTTGQLTLNKSQSLSQRQNCSIDILNDKDVLVDYVNNQNHDHSQKAILQSVNQHPFFTQDDTLLKVSTYHVIDINAPPLYIVLNRLKAFPVI